ncbi:hypothetical protein [Acinetobacter bereziniae]|uniref:hypothetical protein n=1 Tax=Acinetobacter bereziniae TaxID=106648 RepID=UPI003009204A
MNNLLNLKNIFVNASLLGLLLISGANPALAADQAAFVYVAHKNDYGWSYSHDIGRLKWESMISEPMKALTCKGYWQAIRLKVMFGCCSTIPNS